MAITTGKPGTKYVRMEIDLWYQEDDKSIHITSRDDDKFHSTVRDEGESARSHASLWRHLKRVLTEQGRWPEGA